MKWVVDDKPGGGEVLLLGEVIVGRATYDPMRPKGLDAKYIATSRLPGNSSVLDHYTSMSDAKARVERATRSWLQRASL